MKAKVVKKKIGDDTILHLFNQMTGTEDADPILIERKYDNMKFHLGKIVGAWSIFCQSGFAKDMERELDKGLKDIQIFVDESQKLLDKELRIETNKIKTVFDNPLIDELYELGSKYNPKELNEAYRELKTSKLLQQIIITLDNIKTLLEDDKTRFNRHFTCLDIPNALDNTFIVKTELDTKILGFSCLDFQFLYKVYENLVPQFDKLILFALRVTYVNALEVYKIFVSPDIDIEKFVKAFGEKMEGIKKVIPGCDKAFKTLNKSLNLLRENFDVYYKKFMTTNNPSIIFESFLADVQEKNKNDISVMVQFKKIVAYIRKNLPPNMRQNPTVEKLWSISEKLFEKVADD